MAERKAILLLFTGKLLSLGDFTPQGVEKAFALFIASLEEKTVKPPPRTTDNREYVMTTLQEAIAAAKKPIEIPYFVNQYGNKESTIIKGLVLAEDENGDVYATGLQDGNNIVPLTMREVTACKGNGFRYKGSNTVGSAQFTSDNLRV
jgi:hypothetical protein